ncbi:MAG: response regulator [Planctomycetes bacterium]|nr:response regulator [Planctomycetota bacterium]
MKTILVADDEASICKLYLKELEREGYKVVCVSSAREAIQKAREISPSLVVMDIRMPGMDGIEAMSRLLEENNEIPVVINTAYSSYKESFLSWSADAYVVKSSDLTELKDTIRRLLARPEAAAGPAAASGSSQ